MRRNTCRFDSGIAVPQYAHAVGSTHSANTGVSHMNHGLATMPAGTYASPAAVPQNGVNPQSFAYTGFRRMSAYCSATNAASTATESTVCTASQLRTVTVMSASRSPEPRGAR